MPPSEHFPTAAGTFCSVDLGARQAVKPSVVVTDNDRCVAQEPCLGLKRGHELLGRAAKQFDRPHPDEPLSRAAAWRDRGWFDGEASRPPLRKTFLKPQRLAPVVRKLTHSVVRVNAVRAAAVGDDLPR